MSRVNDRVGSSVLLIICLGYVMTALSLPSESPNVSDVGPRMYPLALGVLMSALAAVWVAISFLPPRAAEGGTENEAVPRGGALARVVSLVAVTALFPVLMRPLGFVVTASIFLVASILIVTWQRPTWQRLAVTIVVAVVCSVFFKWLFSDVLSIYLP